MQNNNVSVTAKKMVADRQGLRRREEKKEKLQCEYHYYIVGLKTQMYD